MDTEENKVKDMDAEALAAIARRYYAARFPNPQRLGCPPPGEIFRGVSLREVADQALRDHLFECSECFGEYRQALAQRRTNPEKPAWFEWPTWLVWSGRPILLASLKLSAVVAAALILSSPFIINKLPWRKPALETGNGAIASSSSTETRSETRASDDVAQASSQNAGAAIAAIPNGDQAMAGARKSSGIAAASAETIEVDLDNYKVFRRSPSERHYVMRGPSDIEGVSASGEPDEAPPGEKVISLPATLSSLVLRLPETGVPGKYYVSLINAFG